MHSLFSLDFGSLNLIQSPNMIEVSLSLLFMLSYAPGTLLIHVNFTALPEPEVRVGIIWSLLWPDILPIFSGYEEEYAVSSK
jgi:hypothetical protein